MLQLSRFRVLYGPVCLVVVAAPPSLAAQPVITVSPPQCVWQAGDNPAWAAPNLDESGWQPYTQWKLSSDQPRIWVRCHADLSTLRDTPYPAVQVSLNAAYQVYVNGAPAGGAGDVNSGFFSMNTVHSLPLPDSVFVTRPSTIAARIVYRFATSTLLFNKAPVLQMRAGDESMLEALRARTILAQSARYLETAVCSGVVGVLSVILFGLYLYDRDRRELLLLGIVCMCTAVLRINEFCAAALVGYPVFLSFTLYAVGSGAQVMTEFPFFFAVARRPLPFPYRLVIGVIVLFFPAELTALLLPAPQALWFNGLLEAWIRPFLPLPIILVATAPFVAFWPYSGIPRRMRPLGALCLFWGGVELIFHGVHAASYLPGLPNLFAAWGEVMAQTRGYTTALVVAALVGLLFREQRQITLERAELAGEMHAAQQIQRTLVGELVNNLDCFHIDVAFHPAREVGGDFYCCRVLPGDRQRILIGDVSGKGAAAAMTGAVLLGAAQKRENESPATLLQHLNLVMADMRIGGFATCLCADIASDGTIVIANAGHLAPYYREQEIALSSGFPLGITQQATYAEDSFQLAPGETLTFISDGVVEAQGPQGDLFGFDRACKISSRPAEEIAAAAKRFGQEDDITVLTLTFADAGAVHA